MGIPSTPDKVALHGSITPLSGPYSPIKFQFFPDDISDSKSPNWVTSDIIGRSHPLYGYANSSSRTLSFVMMFYKMDNKLNPLREATKVRALTYPDYSSGNFIKPPPLCLLVLGSIKMTGVITSCDITYRAPWDIRKTIPEPMYVEVSVSFSEAGLTSWGCSDVLSGKDFTR